MALEQVIGECGWGVKVPMQGDWSVLQLAQEEGEGSSKEALG